jgi:chromosome segregation ATPase
MPMSTKSKTKQKSGRVTPPKPPQQKEQEQQQQEQLQLTNYVKTLEQECDELRGAKRLWQTRANEREQQLQDVQAEMIRLKTELENWIGEKSDGDEEGGEEGRGAKPEVRTKSKDRGTVSSKQSKKKKSHS